MRTIKVFIASSEELHIERLEFTDMMVQLNKALRKFDIEVEPVKWEFLDSSMNEMRKQSEYNQQLRQCELCVVMFWTRYGIYTEEELVTAWEGLKGGRNPRKLYVFFKEPSEPCPELLDLKESFVTKYGHFYSKFENVDTLKVSFLLQLSSYVSCLSPEVGTLEFRDSRLYVAGERYANLSNVPFLANNEEYRHVSRALSSAMDELHTMSNDNPERADLEKEIGSLRGRQSNLVLGLWNTAVHIAEICSTRCSRRLGKAIELFNEGRLSGADSVLDEEVITFDMERSAELIGTGKEILKTCVEELLLKCLIASSSRGPGWEDKVDGLYRKILQFSASNLGSIDFANYAVRYAKFKIAEEWYEGLEPVLVKAYEDIKYESGWDDSRETVELLTHCQDCLAELYLRTGDNDKAGSFLRELQSTRARLINDNPDDYIEEMAHSHEHVAICYAEDGRLGRALKKFQEALDKFERLCERDPERFSHDVARIEYDMGYTYQQRKEHDVAAEYYLRSLEHLDAFPSNSSDSTYSLDYYGLAYIHFVGKRYEESYKWVEMGLANEPTSGMLQELLSAIKRAAGQNKHHDD